ncbi:MAG: hypothetical protein OK452_11425, partial [Thaumarchaeota archaeon]|nr:hypothetical protein [Nitrososphaerota archaeon]
FIYGLLKASERDAVVMLDTFFGNLDKTHIRNITKNLSDFGQQIILMVTLTEFDTLNQLADAKFWKHVNRFIFVKTLTTTNLETKVKEIGSRNEAIREAQAQDLEIQGLSK